MRIIYTKKLKTKKMSFTYNFPRPALTVDCVIFGFDDVELKILLIERGLEPFKGSWALPGGFVHINETADEAAKRELFEETALNEIYMEQLYTFSEVERDPRGRVVTIAYYALVSLINKTLVAGDDAKNAKWFPLSNIPKLAFDHKTIVNKALERLKGKIRYQPIGFELLPEKFTISQLQTVYEAILQKTLDRRNFRKKILKTNLLTELSEKQTGVAHKAATYYMFHKEKFEQLSLQGFNFEL